MTPPWASDLEWDRWIASLDLRTATSAPFLLDWFTHGRARDRARFRRWFHHWTHVLSPVQRHELVLRVHRLGEWSQRIQTWCNRPYGHEDQAGVAALLFQETRWLPVRLRTSETWHQTYATATVVGALVALLMPPLSLVWSLRRISRAGRGVLRTVWQMLPGRMRLLWLAAAVGYLALTGVSTWQQAQTCRQWWHVGCHVHECTSALRDTVQTLHRTWAEHPVLQWQCPAWSDRAPDSPAWNWGRALCHYDGVRRGGTSWDPWHRAAGQLEAYVALARMLQRDMEQGRPWSPVQWRPIDHPAGLVARGLHLSGVAPDVAGMDWEGMQGRRVAAITGPNGSGKTMCLLAVGWTLVWGRALGWAPGREVQMARWKHLCTSVRHMTEVGRASLFQAELRFHHAACGLAAPGTWVLLDEPFHSTDRVGAQRCGRWLLRMYAAKKARVVLTTHEPDLLEGALVRCTSLPPFALREGVWTGSVAWDELRRLFAGAGASRDGCDHKNSTSI